MTLPGELRTEFLSEITALAPGADASGWVARFQANREGCEAELGAVPGVDQLRAALVRVLPAVEPDEAVRLPLLQAAAAALESFEADKLTPADALRRHPAWVALCWRELAEQGVGDAETGLEAARAAFAAVSPTEPRGRGELLWAVAEAAADAGWTDHMDALLTEAATATFADPENAGRVRLLVVLRTLEGDESAAAPLVDALLTDEHLDPQTHVHALWIGAHLDREAGDVARAVQRLEEALPFLQDDEDADVRARIEGALTAWGARADAPGEA